MTDIESYFREWLALDRTRTVRAYQGVEGELRVEFRDGRDQRLDTFGGDSICANIKHWTSRLKEIGFWDPPCD